MHPLVYFAANLIDGGSVPNTAANSTTTHNMLMIAFTILGAVAFLLMVIAGFRYIISQGDPQKMATARNQILYTGIGLVIALSAVAIVNYFIGATQ
jgi:uncharacterized membrane protein YidH (DUF202 family)